MKFYTSYAEYEYEIKVSDGSIYSKDINVFMQGGQEPSDGTAISLEQAKSIALDHAKVSESDVTFKEAKLDIDDGIEVYEIEFYYLGREYEYKIRVSDGYIVKHDIDF